MSTKQQSIQIRSNYRNPAHAQAMIAIAACLNSKTQRSAINEEPPIDPLATMSHTERTAYLRSKLINQSQEQALKNIIHLLNEVRTTMDLINQQALIYELNLPMLQLFELGQYGGVVEKRIAEAREAIDKIGIETVLEHLSN